MNKQKALKIILGLAVLGVLFSGYLSYTEIFQATCAIGSCSAKVFTLPACVYGLVMYLIVAIVAALGLKAKN